MRRILLPCLAIGLFLVSGATRGAPPATPAPPVPLAPPAPPAPAPVGELRGTWVVVYYEYKGMKKNLTSTWEFKDDELTRQTTPGGKPFVYKVQLDPTKTPKEIDLTQVSGTTKAKLTRKGIYALEGDTLKICYTNASTVAAKPRPTGFATMAGGDLTYLYILKRQK